jgi:hypothetical protein
MNEETDFDIINSTKKLYQYTTSDLEYIVKNNNTTLYSVLTKYKNLPLHFCVKYFLHPKYDYIMEGLEHSISIYELLHHQPHLKAKDVISCYYNMFGGPISRL